ncbi:MAG TPA: ATP-binding protein [Gemmatimonadales bacterium]|nr:ATP-binding protein [Gemmatimonadales bacterium]
MAAAARALLAPRHVVVLAVEPASDAVLLATIYHEANSAPDQSLPARVIHLAERVLAEETTVTGATPRGQRPSLRWMAAPLRVAARPLGAVLIAVDGAGKFPPAGAAMLEALAAQTAVALDQAWLLELLSQGKREWEQTIDAIREAFCVVGPSTHIRRANLAFGALARRSVLDLRDRPVLDVLPPPCAAAVREVLAHPVGAAPVEITSGDRRYLLTVMPIGEPGARTSVLVFEDQSEQRRLQEQLVQSEKMSAVGQLIAGVAHDLNNPLASVVGFADYLVESAADVPPRLQEPLRAIQQEAERAAKIVRNLLSFARKQEPRRKAQPMGPVLEATLLLLNNEFLGSHVTPVLEVEHGLPHVEMDANQIQQVMVNLLTNAVQAIRTSGVGSQVTVRAARWLDGVAVTVEDDGPGIPPDVRERVFEPFFTTKPEGQGTGLGLAICNGIVAEHGGRLELIADEKAGVTFRLELPGAAAQAEAPRQSLPPVGPLNVLVVDDEPHILHYMDATLTAWGHRVAVSVDGGEALERAVNESFDLIISDLRMPRVGGREFYEALRASHPEVAARVVFSTGDTVRGDALAFLEGLGRPYLRKPFSLAELRATLAGASPRKQG